MTSTAHRLVQISNLRVRETERILAAAKAALDARQAERDRVLEEQNQFKQALPARHTKLRADLLANTRNISDLEKYRLKQNEILQEEQVLRQAIHQRKLAVEEAKVQVERDQSAHNKACAIREKRAELAKTLDAQDAQIARRKSEEINEELANIRAARGILEADSY